MGAFGAVGTGPGNPYLQDEFGRRRKVIRLEQGNYYGAPLRRRRYGAVTLAETEYAPFLEIPAHRHERAYFCLVLAGGYRERTPAGDRACGAGTLLYHGRDSVHSDRFGAEMSRCFNIELAGEIPAMPGDAAARLSAAIYREFRTSDAFTALAIEALTAELVAAPATAVPHASWLETLRAVLHATASAPPPLARLAEIVGVHPTHTARAFRKAFGCTMGEYIRHLRIERAKPEVLGGDFALSEIAQRAGFADQSHFTRAFKRVTGTTPGTYRRQRVN